ncbi:MAG: hypothetical protein ABSA39_11965 [Edaphobacter sp.]
MKKKWSALVALGIVLALGTYSFAQGPFYPLIVNGSTSLKMDYTDGVLVVQFRRTLRAAGQPGTYVHNVTPGTAAWVDRPLNAQEPLMLKQTMTAEQAEVAMARLRQNGGYWRFYCQNAGKGYFAVSRSEAAYASVKID